MGLFDFFKRKNEKKIKNENSENDKKRRLSATENILISMISDLKKNPVKSKLQLKNDQWIYKFDNGKQVRLILIDGFRKFEIIHDTYWWIIGSERLHNLIDELFNYHNNLCNKEKTYENNTQQKKSEEDSITHPLKDKYNLLVRQIKLRQSELHKYKLNDPKREVLENELNNYKKAADKLKAKIFST